MNLIKSFAFKNAIIYFLVFLLGLGVVGFLMLRNSSNRIINTAKDQLTHNGELIEIQIKDYIGNLVSDQAFLVKSPVLDKFLEDESFENYDLLTKSYLSLLQSNEGFSQIRFISVPNGKEIVRVERIGNKTSVIREPNLQYKKGRTYFAEALKLDSTSIYFSPIDLNKEFGKISIPWMPTLRLARPVYKQGAMRGVIVININLTKLFAILKNTVGADYSLEMLNEDGYFLMHESKDSTFVFELENKSLQPQIDVSTFSANKDRIISSPNTISSMHRFRVDEMDYDFIYRVSTERKLLMSSYYEWRRASVFLILFTGLLFTIIAFLILSKQANTLRTFTNNMKAFAENRKIEQLPINRNDEIGDLAKSFEDMSSIINDQMTSIENEKKLAQTAEKEKSEFLENISHEIRNPLQSIVGLSKILRQNNPNPNQIEILNSIELNSANLVGLLNSILDYQTILKGKISLKLQYVSIKQFLNELVIGNQTVASQKNINIRMVIDQDLQDKEIELDRLRISQILGNLISNAITHSPINSVIVVKVDLIKEESNTYNLGFSVVDQGVGLSNKALEKISDRYYSNKDPESKGQSNYGLGLTIVNELLGIFKSELKVSSEKNIGSEFYFELVCNGRAFEKNKRETLASDDVPKGLELLVIEDDKQILELYGYYLEDQKTTFISQIEDLHKIKNKTFDLIISDFNMNGKTVEDFLEELKFYSKKNTWFLLASGAKVDLETLKKYFAVVLAIEKPFDKEALHKKITLGTILSKYGIPRLEVIKKDYDFNKVKYERAISLLISEWEELGNRLNKCMMTGDLEDYEEVIHKFNTTLRRIKLFKLEKLLIDKKKNIKPGKTLPEKEINQISIVMNTYLDYLKTTA